MKRLHAIFLFLCLTAPFFGTYSWLKMEKYKVKKSIKWRMIDGMDKKELVLLKFTEEESKTKLRWEHSREFEYNRQMYDIVEQDIIGDTTYYWCWWDYEETKLNRQLSDLVSRAMGQNPQNRDKQNRLQTFLKNLYCFDLNTGSTLPVREIEIFTAYCFSCILFHKIPSTPPPESAV